MTSGADAATKRVRVVAALLEVGGRLLIQRRPPGGPRGGLWEFPGGKREPGETDEAALARECREELGIEIEVGARAWETEHAYPDLVVALALYHCRLVSGEPRAHDGQTLAWEPSERLADHPFCEADRPFLHELAKGHGGPKRFRVGAYGVLIQDGRVLLTRTRTKTGVLNNFPGGAVELGEGALEALRRELREETGLEVRPRDLLYASERCHRSVDYPENQLVKLYWRVEVVGGRLELGGNGDDVEGCFWAPVAGLEAAGLTPSDLDAVTRFRELGVI